MSSLNSTGGPVIALIRQSFLGTPGGIGTTGVIRPWSRTIAGRRWWVPDLLKHTGSYHDFIGSLSLFAEQVLLKLLGEQAEFFFELTGKMTFVGVADLASNLPYVPFILS